MNAPSPATVVRTGVVDANPALARLLGLCPLLAVSGSAVGALGLGLATLVALALTGAAVSLLRPLTGDAIRVPVSVLLIGGVVTAIELAMHALAPALHAALGLFVPLIATNCVVLARADAFASRQPPALAALDGAAHGVGFAAVLLALGAVREALGSGTLFAGAGPLLGLPGLELRLADGGFPLAAMPVGAFLLLAAAVAAHGAWRRRSAR